MRAFELNAKEKAVLSAFPRVEGGDEFGPSISIVDLAHRAFRKKGSSPGTTGNSWVRNSLRKLVRGGLVAQVAEGKHTGLYRRTNLKVADVKVLPPKKKKVVVREEPASVNGAAG